MQFSIHTAPSSAPTNLITSNITSSIVHLSWDSIPINSQNGIINYYQVNLTESDTGTMFSLIAYSNELLIVQDLHPYYLYHVSVAAYTVEIGPYSAILSFQTNQDGN